MTTLEDATARTQAVIEALDEAATRMTACGDYLDSITAQLDALGTYGRAREASATRDGAEDRKSVV